MNKSLKSIQEIETEIFEEFELYLDWSDKYEYLVELGRGLAKLNPKDKVEKNKLANCTSRVWITSQIDQNNCIYFEAESDSLIIAGLLALVLRLYNGQSPANILSHKLEVFTKIGFDKNLTATRSNGLYLILTRVKEICNQ